MSSDSDWSDPDNPRPKKPARRATFYQEPKRPAPGSSWHMSYCFFHGLLGKLLNDGIYSDFTIRCGGREWHVHKAIVCPQSETFDAAVNGRFKEAATGVVTLNDDEPEIVDYLIQYFYHHNFDDKDIIPPTPPHEQSSEKIRMFDGSKTDQPIRIPDCLKVYAIADKYMVGTLRVMAQTRFEQWCATNYHTQSFLMCIREIYERKTGNYEDLHEAVLIPMAKRIDELLANKHFVELMEDCGELGVELLKKVNDWNRIARQGLEVDIAFLRSHEQAISDKNRKLADENRRLSRTLLALRSADAAGRTRRASVISIPTQPQSPSQPQLLPNAHFHSRSTSETQTQFRSHTRSQSQTQTQSQITLPIRSSPRSASRLQPQVQAQAQTTSVNDEN